MEKITADEAARLVEDGDAILISGSGGGHSVPEALLAAVERRFLARGQAARPHVGQRRRRRRSRRARARRISRTKGCSSARSPARWSIRRDSCASRPRTRSRRTRCRRACCRSSCATWRRAARACSPRRGCTRFVDPRQQGARQSPRTPPDFVEVVNLAGEEWLFFKPVPVNVAFLRGTTADEDGNVTMEQEAVLGEMLADGAGDAARRGHRDRAGEAHGPSRHAAGARR